MASNTANIHEDFDHIIFLPSKSLNLFVHFLAVYILKALFSDNYYNTFILDPIEAKAIVLKNFVAKKVTEQFV